MRTIKFRAWDKDANCMVYSNNEDDYWWEMNPLRCGYIAGESSGNQDEPSSPVPDYCDNVMQFTGLQDKNGKDIYEGDLLKYEWVGKEVGEITWDDLNNNGWVIRRKRYEDKADFEARDDGLVYAAYNEVIKYEVIGNIHENPELLN